MIAIMALGCGIIAPYIELLHQCMVVQLAMQQCVCVIECGEVDRIYHQILLLSSCMTCWRQHRQPL